MRTLWLHLELFWLLVDELLSPPAPINLMRAFRQDNDQEEHAGKRGLDVVLPGEDDAFIVPADIDKPHVQSKGAAG